jgi:hypothetical protein
MHSGTYFYRIPGAPELPNTIPWIDSSYELQGQLLLFAITYSH